MPRLVLIGALAVTTTVVAACGTAAQVEVVEATPVPVEATLVPAEETPTAAATLTPEPTPTSEPTATTEPTPTPTLAGEPFDFLVPVEGELVAVVGVFFDDILEVHEAPGENTPLVGELPNLADNVEGTGQGRLLPNSIWWRIRWGDVEGWVGSSFMARIGTTTDVTVEVMNLAGGSLEAETMLDLGTLVAGLLDSDDPASRVVVSVAPTIGDLGEITMDIIGLGDDALGGLRVTVFGQPNESGEGFTLRTVESTALCSRGVTPDGLCR